MAFTVTLLFFIFSWLLGLSFLSLFTLDINSREKHLIAPTVGFCISTLIVYFLNISDLPIDLFSRQLLIAQIIFILIVLILKKPSLVIDITKPALIILSISLVIVGYPMMIYGFDWIGYANDDMANYVLGAERIQQNGFFAIPNFEELVNGGDRNQHFWFMHAVLGHRVGSEILLAYFSSITSLNGHQAFMPLIIMLHLCLISSVGALVSNMASSKNTTLIAMALVGISPLVLMGALYQLIAQVGGLAILVCSLVLLLRDQSKYNFMQRVIKNIPLAIVLITFVIYYTEIIPFLGAIWILYLIHEYRYNKANYKSTLINALILIIIALLVLQESFFRYALFLWAQLGQYIVDTPPVVNRFEFAPNPDVIVFPYYLIPSGLANIWGLLPITYSFGGLIAEHMIVNFLIFIAIINFYFFFRYVLPHIFKRNFPAFASTLIMLFIFSILFIKQKDFPLFKLAMFMQPFIFACVAIYIANKLSTFNYKVKGFLMFNIFCMISSGLYYSLKSTDYGYGGLNEIPSGSELRVNQQFKELTEKPYFRNCSKHLISDTSNVVLAKYQSLYIDGETRVFFPSRDYFGNVSNADKVFSRFNSPDELSEDTSLATTLMDTTLIDGVIAYENLRDEIYTTYNYYFDYVSNNFKESDKWLDDDNIISNKFVFRNDIKELINSTCYIMTNNKQDTFNTLHTAYDSDFFSIVEKPINKLLFVHSKAGEHYYGPRNAVAFTQLEPDPMLKTGTMSAYGQDLLFLSLNPQKNARLIFEASSTVIKQHASKLPSGIINNQKLSFKGRGSARILTDPIEPFQVDGVDFSISTLIVNLNSSQSIEPF